MGIIIHHEVVITAKTGRIPIINIVIFLGKYLMVKYIAFWIVRFTLFLYLDCKIKIHRLKHKNNANITPSVNLPKKLNLKKSIATR